MTPDILQPEIYKRLVRVVEKGRVGGAYLFSGPRGCGKEAMAIEFAGMVNGGLQKPDVMARFRKLSHELLKLVFPLSAPKDSKTDDPLKHLKADEMEWIEKVLAKKARDPFFKIEFPGATRITLASIRELRKSLILKSMTGGIKVVLIFDAHYLSMGQGESANALLKILEEPPPDTIFVLVTDHKTELLSTILSRCQHLDFPPLDDERIRDLLDGEGVGPDSAELIVTLARGDAHLARSLAKTSQEELKSILRGFLEPLLKPDPDRWRKFVNSYSQLVRKDPAAFRFHIYLIRVWLHNQFRDRHGEAVNAFLKSLAGSIEKQYPNADFLRMDASLNELLKAPSQNLYMPLSLLNFLTIFQHALEGKRI